jgi:hypothetical protein
MAQWRSLIGQSLCNAIYWSNIGFSVYWCSRLNGHIEYIETTAYSPAVGMHAMGLSKFTFKKNKMFLKGHPHPIGDSAGQKCPGENTAVVLDGLTYTVLNFGKSPECWLGLFYSMLRRCDQILWAFCIFSFEDMVLF